MHYIAQEGCIYKGQTYCLQARVDILHDRKETAYTKAPKFESKDRRSLQVTLT